MRKARAPAEDERSGFKPLEKFVTPASDAPDRFPVTAKSRPAAGEQGGSIAMKLLVSMRC